MVPGLGGDAGWLQKNANIAKRRSESYRELWLDAKSLGAITIAMLDAALGIKAVAAHVPFAAGARRAWNRVRPTNNADHEIAGNDPALSGRGQYTPQRLVPQDEPFPARRRGSVSARHDITIGPAHTDHQRVHEHSAVGIRGFWNIIQSRRVGHTWYDGERPHNAARISRRS